MATALLRSAWRSCAKAKKSNCNAKKFIFAYLPKNTLYFMEVCIMIHERKSGHFRRQYSAQAKKAGEAMMKVMRDFAEPLSVQDARDACTFCRNILESQVRGCPYNDAALEAEEDLDAVANADEPDA
jgi:hypothetical protein